MIKIKTLAIWVVAIIAMVFAAAIIVQFAGLYAMIRFG